MDSEETKVRGVINVVGIERDEDHFRSFNLSLGVVVKDGKGMSYEEGEKLMNVYRKEYLGREVNITPIMVICPTCGKGFNSEQGMKQHVRIVHQKKKKSTRTRTKRKTTPRKRSKKP